MKVSPKQEDEQVVDVNDNEKDPLTKKRMSTSIAK
jgi:hypothetical protein